MTIKARYAGRCSKCGRPVNPGDLIEWDRDTRLVSHVTCSDASASVTKGDYGLSGGSGYGCHGWRVGQVLRATDGQRAKGYPEWLIVLTTGQRYYREDGMCFGVGDDSGYVYCATCRQATPEEAAPALANYEAGRARLAAEKRLGEIKADIQARGVRPNGDNRPGGRVILDTLDLYGGGDCFVLEETKIWYVRNNGMDGDDWSRNNVITGGAGAIGWYAPATPELVAELDQLAAILSRRD